MVSHRVKGFRKGKQVAGREQKAFLLKGASSGHVTWAGTAFGSESIYTGMYMVYGLLGTIQVGCWPVIVQLLLDKS